MILEEKVKNTFLNKIRNSLAGKIAVYGLASTLSLSALTLGCGDDDGTATTTATGYNIVINEIMQNPSAVLDTAGEWFELYNGGNSAVDIDGWTISDLGSDSYTIAGSLIISPNDYVVLCRNSDPLLNGNAPCDYQYSGFILGNTDDEIILTTDLELEVDRVVYDDGVTFPDPTGASMELMDYNLDNNDGSNWQEATTSYGDGDLGTPGDANVP